MDNGLEQWYFYHSQDDIRIDALVDDLRTFCKIRVTEMQGEECIWLEDESQNGTRMFLSANVCCSNSQENNRITDVLSKNDVFLIPYQFNDTRVYEILTELARNADVVKIDYSVKGTKLLNQFQIQVNVSDYPNGMHVIPELLSDRLGITAECPIRSVHIPRKKVTLRPALLEQPETSNANEVLLQYLLRCSITS